MSHMFRSSKATVLDLSSFDMTKVTGKTSMLTSAKATTGYAKDEAAAAIFNAISGKPSTLVFTIKS